MCLCLAAEVPNRALIRWMGKNQTEAIEFEFEDGVSRPDEPMNTDRFLICFQFVFQLLGKKIQQSLLQFVCLTLEQQVVESAVTALQVFNSSRSKLKNSFNMFCNSEQNNEKSTYFPCGSLSIVIDTQ